MKRILITGASGALGRAVVARLEKDGEVQIFVAGRQCLDTETSIRCDVRDKEQIIAAIELAKPDIILHLAATLTHDLDEACAVNVESSRHILDFIQSKYLKTRVVLIGSAAEYGVVQPCENPISEDHVLAPVSTYGISKAWQTQLMSKYVVMGGVDVLCARVFNLYGEGMSKKLFAGKLSSQIAEVLQGKQTVIEVGALTAIRDYISTTDAADKLLTIVYRGQTGKIYHIASGVPISMREFAEKQLLAYGLDTSILKEVKSATSDKGYDVPLIFADTNNFDKLSFD